MKLSPAIAICGLLALAGCGGDDTTSASKSPTVSAHDFARALPDQFVGQVCLVVATKGYPAAVSEAKQDWGKNKYGLDPQRILNETLTRCES